MKLKYKILWVEDNPKSIRRDKSRIIEYLTDLGFECIDSNPETDIEIITSFDEFQTKIGYSKTSDFDLLLVDLDLGKRVSKDEGEEIIRKVRDAKVYSEIIFYSSQYEELKRKLEFKFVEGIFTSSREELYDKVENIIDVTIKKTQDVNNLRGLIMAEVAELDIIKEEIIEKASVKINNKDLEKYVLNKIKSSGKSCLNKAQKHLDDIDNVIFKSLFKKPGFVDSNKKAFTIGEALEKLNITNPVTKTSFTQPYIDSILTKRNKFAHIRECMRNDENGNQCKFIDDIPFTEEKCIEIRKEIKSYKQILEEIKNLL